MKILLLLMSIVGTTLAMLVIPLSLFASVLVGIVTLLICAVAMVLKNMRNEREARTETWTSHERDGSKTHHSKTSRHSSYRTEDGAIQSMSSVVLITHSYAPADSSPAPSDSSPPPSPDMGGGG